MTTYLITTESAIGFGLYDADSPEQALDQLAADTALDREALEDYCRVYGVPKEYIEAAEGFGPDTPADDPTFAAIVAAY